MHRTVRQKTSSDYFLGVFATVEHEQQISVDADTLVINIQFMNNSSYDKSSKIRLTKSPYSSFRHQMPAFVNPIKCD